MKKYLIATTALTLSAGFAAAEVKIGGYAFAGFTTLSNGQYEQRIRLEFTGTATTSAGTSISAYFRMDNGLACNLGGSCGTRDDFSYQRITIKHENLTLALGSTDGAMRTLARHKFLRGFNDADIIRFSNTMGFVFADNVHADFGANALVRYDAGAFSFAASSTLTGSSQEVAVQYAANGLNVGAGLNTTGAWMVKAGYEMGDLSMGIGHNSRGTTSANVSYKRGDWDFGLGVLNLGTRTDVGLDVGYSLGGSVRLSASTWIIGDGSSISGAGLMFNF